MRIATFNVNSLAKRLEALLGFLDERKVDLALLQETKCTQEQFPLQALEQAGWRAAFVAEKAYNGVAVLSRDPALSVRRSALPLPQEMEMGMEMKIEKKQEGQEEGLDTRTDAQADAQADAQEADTQQVDTQARYVEVWTHGLIAASIYAPNGNPLSHPSGNPSSNPSGNPSGNPLDARAGEAGGEKFRYKIAWMDRLCRHVEERLVSEGRPFLLGGDFNICPQSQDVFDEQAMEGDALLHEESRRCYRRLVYNGLVDAFRAASNPQHKERGYTYWDYRRSRFPRNEGLRIDMFLLSSALSERIEGCFVERSLREGVQPSDHTPLCLDLAWKTTPVSANVASANAPKNPRSEKSLQSRLAM